MENAKNKGGVMWGKFIIWIKMVIKRLTPFAKKIVKEVVVPLLIQFGKEAGALLWDLIIQAAQNSSLSGDQKSAWVTKQFKEQWKGELFDTASINAAKEIIYLQYKKGV